MMGKLISNIFKKNEIENAPVPIPNEVYNWKIYLFSMIAAFGAVICGYDTGFIGSTVTLDSFLNEFGFDDMTSSEKTLVKSNIISVFHVGAFFGALIIYPVGELLGRKIALNVSGFLLTFGSAISLASNTERGLGPIYAGRVLTGLGVGFCSGIAPMYISEISPASIRGQLGGMWELSWQVGGLVGYWINLGVQEHVSNQHTQWLIPFAVQLIPAGIFWIGGFFIPESPRWLVSRYRSTKAEKTLANITMLPIEHEFIQYEILAMESLREARKNQYGEGILKQIQTVFTSTKYIKRLIISTSVFIFQNGSGINAVTYYSVTVFQSIGLSGSSSKLLSTGIFGVIKIVATIFWLTFIIENLGRRSTLFYGCIPCAITMWYLGAYIYISKPEEKLASGNSHLDGAGKGALAMFYIWTFAYGASINGTSWVYCSELFDQSIRSLVGSINASSNWFWAFIFARFTGNMFTAMGYGVYFLFAGCMTVIPVIIYCFYPETKGIPLEAVDYLFQVPAWKAHSYAKAKMNETKEMQSEDSSIKQLEVL